MKYVDDIPLTGLLVKNDPTVSQPTFHNSNPLKHGVRPTSFILYVSKAKELILCTKQGLNIDTASLMATK